MGVLKERFCFLLPPTAAAAAATVEQVAISRARFAADTWSFFNLFACSCCINASTSAGTFSHWLTLQAGVEYT